MQPPEGFTLDRLSLAGYTAAGEGWSAAVPIPSRPSPSPASTGQGCSVKGGVGSGSLCLDAGLLITRYHMVGHHAPHKACKLPRNRRFDQVGRSVLLQLHMIVFLSETPVCFIRVSNDLRGIPFLPFLQRGGFIADFADPIPLG